MGKYLSDITLILLGAGNSTRFKNAVKKQWLYIDEEPLWLYVTKKFQKNFSFKKIIIVSSKEEIKYMKHFASFDYVQGGETRQASLSNALTKVSSKYVLVSDIARCCIPKKMIQRILDAKEKASCIVPSLTINDTVYFKNQPINREEVKIIQTPQLSKTKLLKKALNTHKLFTDDSSAIVSLNKKIHFVRGSKKAHKLTRIKDLKELSCLKAPSSKTLTGFGIDTHPFEENKEMFLCGVPLKVPYGFKAHSDGDVAIHAIIDALLGAVGLGDIGELYPDNNAMYKNIDSTLLLKDTVSRITSFGYCISHIDLTIVAQKPKISPYKDKMRQKLALILGINTHLINIKATTSEKLGFIGREEGITAHAIANLNYMNWKNL